MKPPQPTARVAWIARCVWRLKRQYSLSAPLPGQERSLTYAEYVTLVQRVLAEHRED